MNRKRIMIVEDEMVVAEDIQRCLEQSGYAVPENVASGEEAVEVAKMATFDLVMMDIQLAGSMDGIDAAAAITAMVDVPIVYLTAYSDDAILERARLTEPFGYLVKPFDRRELKSTIEMAIYKHRKLTEKIREMAARSRSAAKRSAPANPDEGSGRTALGFGFEYAPEDGTLLYFGREVNLTKKEHGFIRLLVENLDRTVTYAKIESYVWSDSGLNENNLRIFLWRLRSKIGKDLVKNNPGLGYRMERPAAE